MERMAEHQSGSGQVRSAFSGDRNTIARFGINERTPLRTPAVQDVQVGAQPFLSSGLRSEDMDVPLLFPTEPFPSALRFDLGDESTRGAVPAMHKRRVHFTRGERGVPCFPLSSRHLSHRRGARVSESFINASREPAT